MKYAIDSDRVKPVGGLKVIAATFARKLVEIQPASYALGIFGDFGVGKSILLREIRSRIDNQYREMDAEDVITVWFDAWRYTSADDLTLPLLHHIRAAVVERFGEESAGAFGRAVRGLIAGATLKIGPLEFSSKDAASREAELKAAEVAMSQALDDYQDFPDILASLPTASRRKRRFVVFIDDLDRCSNRMSFNLLEDIRRFFGIEGYVFVVGMNPKAVRNHLKSSKGGFSDRDTRQWLEKVFQEEYPLWPELLPVSQQGNIGEFFLVRGIEFHPDVWGGECKCSRYMPANLRQAKRICNAYWSTITMFELSAPDDLRSVLAALIFRVRWPRAYVLALGAGDASQVLDSMTGKAGGQEHVKGLKEFCGECWNIAKRAFGWVRPDFEFMEEDVEEDH